MRTTNFNDTDDLILAEHRRWAEQEMRKASSLPADRLRSRRTEGRGTSVRPSHSGPVFSMRRREQPDERYDRVNDLWRINESDVVTGRRTIIDKIFTLLYKWLRK